MFLYLRPWTELLLKEILIHPSSKYTPYSTTINLLVEVANLHQGAPSCDARNAVQDNSTV